MKEFIKIFAKTYSFDIILNILFIIYNSIALKKEKNFSYEKPKLSRT
jgi:hypothetical protein